MGVCLSTPTNHKAPATTRLLPGPYQISNEAARQGVQAPVQVENGKQPLQPVPARSEPSEQSSSRATNDSSPRHELPAVDSAQQVKWNWKQGPHLGRGAYGTVFLGINKDSGRLMAVKQVEAPIAADVAAQRNVLARIRELEDEVRTLRQLNHPNIVRYLGTERTDKHVNIFLEWVPGGSIHKLLSDFGPFPEKVVRLFTKDVLEGLRYLHQKGIMHRDIKGQNVLLDGDGKIKLADFGASTQVHNVVEGGSMMATRQLHKSMKGTPYFMAPEVITRAGHGRSADIWSLGCLVYEMCTGRPPWCDQLDKEHDQMIALYHIVKSGVPTIPSTASPECKDFLSRCWDLEPKTRATCEALLKHPFIVTTPCDVVRASLMGSISLQSRLVGAVPSPIQEGADEPEPSPLSRSRLPRTPPSPPNQLSPPAQRLPLDAASPVSKHSHAPPPTRLAAAAPAQNLDADASGAADERGRLRSPPQGPFVKSPSPWRPATPPGRTMPNADEAKVSRRPFTADQAADVAPIGFLPPPLPLTASPWHNPAANDEPVHLGKVNTPEPSRVVMPSLASYNPMNSFAGDLVHHQPAVATASPQTPPRHQSDEPVIAGSPDSPEVRLSRHLAQVVHDSQEMVRRSQICSTYTNALYSLAPPAPLSVPQTTHAGAPLSPISENSNRLSANRQSKDSVSGSVEADPAPQRKHGKAVEGSAASRENRPAYQTSRKRGKGFTARSSFVEFNDLNASVDDVPGGADADIRKTVEMMLEAERSKLRG